jgi:hypothetical protein
MSEESEEEIPQEEEEQKKLPDWEEAVIEDQKEVINEQEERHSLILEIVYLSHKLPKDKKPLQKSVLEEELEKMSITELKRQLQNIKLRSGQSPYLLAECAAESLGRGVEMFTNTTGTTNRLLSNHEAIMAIHEILPRLTEKYNCWVTLGKALVTELFFFFTPHEQELLSAELVSQEPDGPK